MTLQPPLNHAPQLEPAMREELSALSAHIGQMRDLVVDAVTKLSQGFQQLSVESTHQQSLLEGTLSRVDSKAGEGSIAGFIQQSSLQMDSVLLGLERASERTVELASRLEAAMSNLARLGTLSRDVQSISEQIKYLSLNASIEASHAGNAGRGFAIVASEVKELSKQFRSISDRMSSTVNETRTAIGSVTSEARSAVESDTELVQRARASAQSLARDASSLDHKLGTQLSTAHEIGASLQQGINLCVMGLQFGDLVTQISRTADERIDTLAPLLESSARVAHQLAATDPVLDRQVATFIEKRQLIRANAVHQVSLDSGDVELF